MQDKKYWDCFVQKKRFMGVADDCGSCPLKTWGSRLIKLGELAGMKAPILELSIVTALKQRTPISISIE